MKYMRLAIQSAVGGIQNGEGGPFGACIVRDDEVIAVGHSTVLKSCDPTCHAEINVIRAAARKLQTHVLSGYVLYATAEPCPMCLAAAYWARIDKIIYGVPKEQTSQYGFDDHYFYKELQQMDSEKSIQIEGQVQLQECLSVFAKWRELQLPLY